MPAPAVTKRLPLIVIAGPTGSGKSALALALAEKFHGEILNFDSLQLYRGLDIGTAKPSREDRNRVPHHLFDVLSIGQGFSAGEFGQLARPVATEIALRGALPVAVGGTGFYLKALLEGLPALPVRDEELRTRLQQRELRRPGSLHRLLTRLDPPSAEQIHANDQQKVLRALEVRILTGESRTAATGSAATGQFCTFIVGLDPDRDELRARLEKRTRAMFQNGLVEEVQALLSAGTTGREKPFEALGYRQVLQYLRGEVSLEQATESTINDTRQYAKRQRTWFRRDPQVHWLPGFGETPEVQAAAFALVTDSQASSLESSLASSQASSQTT